jgi:hypothetical protein
MKRHETSLTRRQRAIVAAFAWILIGPVVVGFGFIAWWFGLGLFFIAAWTTWDYIRKGDMAGHIGEGMSKSGMVAKGFEESFGRPDKD